MKTFLLIVLALGFFTMNAQQVNQTSGKNSPNLDEQYYTDYHPDNPVLFDLNRYAIRKTDNTGFPVYFDLNRYTIRKTDNLGYPEDVDLNRYAGRKTDAHPGYPEFIDTYRNRLAKTD